MQVLPGRQQGHHLSDPKKYETKPCVSRVFCKPEPSQPNREKKRGNTKTSKKQTNQETNNMKQKQKTRNKERKTKHAPRDPDQPDLHSAKRNVVSFYPAFCEARNIFCWAPPFGKPQENPRKTPGKQGNPIFNRETAGTPSLLKSRFLF